MSERTRSGSSAKSWLAMDERGMSLVEISLASAIILVAFLALMQMITAGSTGAKGNQLRSLATSEAIYSIENVKAETFSGIPTSPTNRYVTDAFNREGADFTRVVHYHYQTTIGTNNLPTASRYFIVTVNVRWATPPPVKIVTMSIFKMP